MRGVLALKLAVLALCPVRTIRWRARTRSRRIFVEMFELITATEQEDLRLIEGPEGPRRGRLKYLPYHTQELA